VLPDVAGEKELQTTNALERINEEFRRRTKIEASLPSSDTVVRLLFGVLRSGAVKLRTIDAATDISQVAMKAA
jgi:putative transposase